MYEPLSSNKHADKSEHELKDSPSTPRIKSNETIGKYTKCVVKNENTLNYTVLPILISILKVNEGCW